MSTTTIDVMPPDDVAELLANPDAVLFHKDKSAALLEKLNYFTVPFWFFDEGVDPTIADPASIKADAGSGILVTLRTRSFILTAGHCVEEFQRRPCAIGIRKEPHRFIPRDWKRTNFRFDRENGRDFGYIEIPADVVGEFKAGCRNFLSFESLVVQTKEALRASADWMAISGYPNALVEAEGTGHGARMLMYPTTIAGTGGAPQSTLTLIDPPFLEYVDLWVPHGKAGLDPAQDYVSVDIPLLGGMSGGGCWKLNVRPHPDRWSLRSVKLAGIHVGSSKHSDRDRFAREVLVGHHLRMIAENYSDLAPTIFDRWPLIKDENWTTW